MTASSDASSGAAGQLKDQGNKLFKAGDFLKSAALYTQALRCKDLDGHETAVLYSNRSAALLKLQKIGKALSDAEDSIKADPSFHKAWMRKALVLESQQRYEEALSCYQQALQACPDNAEYTARVKVLAKLANRAAQTAATTAKQQTKSPSELAALAFADGKLAYAAELAAEGGGFEPELHFLCSSGSNSSSGGSREAETAVRAAHAFDAPETLVQFTGEMRAKAQELAATAVVLIASKAAVAFPQTWQQPSWPFGQHDGVFVQLQALVKQQGNGKDRDSSSQDATLLRKLWFIRLRPGRPPLEAQEVSPEFDLLLQPLIK